LGKYKVEDLGIIDNRRQGLAYKTHVLEYTAQQKDAGMKLMDVLHQSMELSGRMIRRSKKEKSIKLNAQRVSLNSRIRKGDLISIEMRMEKNIFEPEDIPVNVAYEDADILVVNKQPFLVVHPTKGHPYGTLANGIAHLFESEGLDIKIRFINRLDRDTSGLMMIAKNPYAQTVISEQMEGTVVKEYIALVMGRIEKDSGTIDAPIGLENETDIQRKVMANGKACITHFEVIERYGEGSLVKIRLETGRTHQIRVHFSSIGHPLFGDELYGGNHELINRQALHCTRMVFEKPRPRQALELKAEMPDDMKQLIVKLT
jgi:23S rRNA pseudouridine1911/1915/1917 synthase